MIVVTTETIPGQEIVKILGLVRGNTIRARHLGRDIMAGLKSMVGGEIKSYTDLLDELDPSRQTGRLIDVGCGRGWFLIEAAKRGWEVTGTEYSDKAVELCEAAGINMFKGPLRVEEHEPGSFDVVTSFEVMEHINNLHEEVAKFETLLRPGGLFYCTTPNFNSANRYYQKDKFDIIGYPEHLCYFTRRTLNRLLGSHGLRKVRLRTTGISFTRIQTSKGNKSQRLGAKEAPDEKVRKLMDSGFLMRTAKVIANHMLSLTGLGMTLKGYYRKPQ